MLKVRRIPAREIKKYDVYRFLSDTEAGFAYSTFNDRASLQVYLHNNLVLKYEDDNLIQNDVYRDEKDIFFFILDLELKTSYVLRVDYEIKLVELE